MQRILLFEYPTALRTVRFLQKLEVSNAGQTFVMNELLALLPSLGSRGAIREVLEGILRALKTGARWRDLPRPYPSGSTCWRRLRLWEERGAWFGIWRAFPRELDQRGRLDWSECFWDGSFASAKKGASASAAPSAARARSGW